MNYHSCKKFRLQSERKKKSHPMLKIQKRDDTIMWFQKKQKKKQYDRENYEPVIRSSICTGEQAVGFRNRDTGKFEEVMLIKSKKDMELFLKEYKLTEEEIKKEW